MNFCAGILNAVPQEGPEQVGLLIQLLELLAYVGIIMFVLVAVLLMISACVQALYRFFRRRRHTVLYLRKRMNVSLLFILCSEILRLVTAHSFSEVIVIFCIVLIHAAISILSNWETMRELKLYASILPPEEQEELFRSHTNDIDL